MSKPALLLSFAVGCALGFGVALARTPAPDGAGGDAQPSARAAAAGDVEARARQVLRRDDPLERLVALGNLLSELGPSDVPALLAAFEEAPVDGGDPELVMMGLWWAHFDPEAAYQWTVTDWRAQYGSVIAAVFRVWGRSDPERAFQMARGVRFPGQREIATDSTIAGWEESGRPGLMQFLQSLGRTDQQRMGEIIARRRVVSLGPEEAIAWAESIAQPGLRDILSLRVASTAAATPDGAPLAAKWAEPKIAAAERPTGYPRRIATRWIRHDPSAAMAWLEALPAGDDRDDGVTEAFRDWHRRDPAAARAWIEQAELARWNEPAQAVYARMLARERPEEAIALAGRLSEDELRGHALITVGRVWTEDDPEAARAWFAQSGLPEDLVRRATSIGSTPRRERLRAGPRDPDAAAAITD